MVKKSCQLIKKVKIEVEAGNVAILEEVTEAEEAVVIIKQEARLSTEVEATVQTDMELSRKVNLLKSMEAQELVIVANQLNLS